MWHHCLFTIWRVELHPHAVNMESVFTFTGAVSGFGTCFDVWVGKWLSRCVYTNCVRILRELYCLKNVNSWRKHKWKFARSLVCWYTLVPVKCRYVQINSNISPVITLANAIADISLSLSPPSLPPWQGQGIHQGRWPAGWPVFVLKMYIIK